MFPKTAQSVLIIAGIIFAGLFLKACEDNPASSNGEDEHSAAIGFKLLLNDQVLVRYFQLEYELDPEGEFPEFVQGDALYLSAENLDNNRLEDIRLRWIDRDGIVFDHPEYNPEAGGEWNIAFSFRDPDNISQQQPADERPLAFIYDRDEQTWVFDIELLQPGETAVRMELFHLDHADLSPRPLSIIVDM